MSASDEASAPPRVRTFDDLAARYDDAEGERASTREAREVESAGDPAELGDQPPRKLDRRSHRFWSAPAAQGVDGERGISPVGGQTGAATPGKMVGAAAMLLVAGSLIAATWDKGGAAEAEPREQKPAGPVVKFPGPPRLADAATDPNAPLLNPDGAVTAPKDVLPPPPPPGGSMHTVPAISTSSGYAGPVEPAPMSSRSDDRRTVFEAAQRAPIIAWSARQRGEETSDGAVRLAAMAAGPGRAGPGEPTRLDDLRRSSSVGESRARLLPDRKFLITAGTSLPCVLQTALDSSVPGYASCIIPRDVLSDNGRVVLLERGTRVLGECRGGVRQGERRLFVLWTRAVTPAGVAVDLASPAADALGRSGFDGQLDTRFWERFGGALLLSIVDDAAYVAGQSVADSQFNNTSRFPSEAAAVALQNSIGAQPVLRKRQGEDVSILVAQDINFADVYGLRLR